MSDQIDNKPLGSTSMQFIMYIDDKYSVYYFLIELLIFIYKGYGLFYPPNAQVYEVFLLFIFAFLQFGRISIGSSGNKTETPNMILLFIIFCLPCAALFAFFLQLQTYVIMLEIVLNSIGLALLMLEFLFSLSAFLTFKNYERSQ